MRILETGHQRGWAFNQCSSQNATRFRLNSNRIRVVLFMQQVTAVPWIKLSIKFPLTRHWRSPTLPFAFSSSAIFGIDPNFLVVHLLPRSRPTAIQYFSSFTHFVLRHKITKGFVIKPDYESSAMVDKYILAWLTSSYELFRPSRW